MKRAAYRDYAYWGRPVPDFGVARARLLIVGLAPGAHGANRTGRMFTGDRSGDWLFRALHRAGFANQPESSERGDGLEVRDCLISAVCHCAPPDNRPTAGEIDHCAEYLANAIKSSSWVVMVALGAVAWKSVCKTLGVRGGKFGHGAEVELTQDRILLGSYHPSQQNTFTKRLSEAMLDEVFERARNLIGA